MHSLVKHILRKFIILPVLFAIAAFMYMFTSAGMGDDASLVLALVIVPVIWGTIDFLREEKKVNE